MKPKIQAMVVDLIQKNPGATVSVVRELMKDIAKGTLCSTLSRIYFLNLVKRQKVDGGVYAYWINDGSLVAEEPEEEVSEALGLSNFKYVSLEDRERRYQLACELKDKGLYRRADRVLLELLDVTPTTSERERIIQKRAGMSRLEHWL